MASFPKCLNKLKKKSSVVLLSFLQIDYLLLSFMGIIKGIIPNTSLTKQIPFTNTVTLFKYFQILSCYNIFRTGVSISMVINPKFFFTITTG